MAKAGLKHRGASRGFTLIELLLTVALVLLLLGAMVFSFSSLQRGAELDEGTTQLEALLRFARAHAANTGRQVQIDFEEDVGDGLTAPLGNLRVLWEPDPLGQPGLFEELSEAGTYVRSLIELVSVEDVRPVQMGGAGPEANFAAGSPRPQMNDESISLSFAPITFYPDGSSDSAEIILAARGAEDERLMSVRLIGITGTIRRKPLAKEGSSGEIDNQEELSVSDTESLK